MPTKVKEQEKRTANNKCTEHVTTILHTNTVATGQIVWGTLCKVYPI